MTDKLGRTTHYEYDGLGRRVKTTDPKNNTVEKEYDGEGNLLWVEDQNGNRTEYTYDQAGRRIEEEFADGKSKTFAYNLAGYLTQETDQNGSVINNTFDAAGRLTQRNITRASGVAGTTEQAFSYDAAGRMTSSTDNNDPAASGSAVLASKTYDALGRVTEETTAGYMVESTYSGTRRTEIEYPGGTVVTMSHDAAGNMTSVYRDAQLASSFVYDVNNLVVEQTFGNNVTLVNQRDSLYRTTNGEYHKDNTLVVGFSYGYDGMGNKLYQEDLRRPQDSELYDYDDLYRLTSWQRGELNAEKDAIPNPLTDQSWDLDPVGNWDETAYDDVTELRQHNEVNELIHRDNEITTGLTYDDSGNLIEDHEHEYVYDAFNRLVQVVRKSDSEVIATYRYDTQNRRVVRIVENSGNLDGTTQYVYDGWQVVEERDGQGQLEREYTYGNYIDEPITLTAGNDTYYYHTNNMYNVRALADGTGAVVERYRYSAYGSATILDPNDQEIPESTVGSVYMFQGRRLDSETGLYYYRNRMMSAELGRFLQRDPLGYVDGWNLYEFVGGRPPVALDPSGLIFRLPWDNCDKLGAVKDCEVKEFSLTSVRLNMNALLSSFRAISRIELVGILADIGSIATGGVEGIVEYLTGEGMDASDEAQEKLERLRDQLRESDMVGRDSYSIWVRVTHKRCECYDAGWFGEHKRWRKHDRWYECKNFPRHHTIPEQGAISKHNPPLVSREWYRNLVECVIEARNTACEEGEK